MPALFVGQARSMCGAGVSAPPWPPLLPPPALCPPAPAAANCPPLPAFTLVFDDLADDAPHAVTAMLATTERSPSDPRDTLRETFERFIYTLPKHEPERGREHARIFCRAPRV
jgi:hypothetical protein